MSNLTFAADTTFFSRQFKPDSPAYINIPMGEFVKRVSDYYHNEEPVLHDGYADFCKVIIMPNDVGMKYGIMPITPENEQALISRYEARGDSLPVLRRCFSLKKLTELQCFRPEAKYLYIEMYTAEQMRKEEEEGMEPSGVEHTADWTVFNVKPLMEKNEIVPNEPATITRNALGPKFGGSGAEINKEAYMTAVKFFEKNAFVDHLN